MGLGINTRSKNIKKERTNNPARTIKLNNKKKSRRKKEK